MFDDGHMDNETMRAMAEIAIVRPLLRTIVESIEAIKNCESAEEAEVFIGMIDHAKSQMPDDWRMVFEGTTTREQIRDGVGDFAKIRDKCVSLGVV
jgi:hypothetical protein